MKTSLRLLAALATLSAACATTQGAKTAVKPQELRRHLGQRHVRVPPGTTTTSSATSR